MRYLSRTSSSKKGTTAEQGRRRQTLQSKLQACVDVLVAPVDGFVEKVEAVEAQIEENTRQGEANTNTLEAMQTRIDAHEKQQQLIIYRRIELVSV